MSKRRCESCKAELERDRKGWLCRDCLGLKALRARKAYTLTPGYVYLAQKASGGDVKIGFSVQPEQRLKGLRNQWVDCKDLRLVATLEVPNGEYELILHRIFDDIRVNCEWFTPTETIRALIHAEGWTIYNDLIVEALL